MAQLSTDTLTYAQVINQVQEFINKYIRNQNVTTKEFDDAYQVLVAEIRKKVSGPVAELDFIHKGDIPSSERINSFIKKMTNDINIIGHQYDSLSANYVNTFNLMQQNIDAERSSLSRIKSKIAALELYSESSSRNVDYYGDLLNDMDSLDSMIDPNVPFCDVSDGIASLPRKEIKKWNMSAYIYNQNYNDKNNQLNNNTYGTSNGLPGCNFLFSKETINNIINPFIFQKDVNNIKTDPNRMVDETPISYFEYEAINIDDKKDRPLYEFQYANKDNYIDWSTFDITKPLKLTVELVPQGGSPQYVNYISIIPFFGYDDVSLNADIKNIKISSIILVNDKTNVAPKQIIQRPTYIGSDFSIGKTYANEEFFYHKGIFKFQETLANKIYITFENNYFQDVEIKHAYWTPYTSSDFEKNQNTAKKWSMQERFNPDITVLPKGSYDIFWDQTKVVPKLETPNSIKSSSSDVVNIDLKYNLDVIEKGAVLELRKGTTDLAHFYEITQYLGNSYYVFTRKPKLAQAFPDVYAKIVNDLVQNTNTYPCVLLADGEDVSDLQIKMSYMVADSTSPVKKLKFVTTKPHGLVPQDIISIKGRIDYSDRTLFLNRNYTVLNKVDDYSFEIYNEENLDVISNQEVIVDKLVCVRCFTKASKFAGIENIFIVEKEEYNQKSYTIPLWLKKNFETIQAKRSSIGIRDIYIGRENYENVSQIISKPFYVYKNVNLMSLKVSDYIPQGQDSSSSIDYYISVDDGVHWIQISPVERNYSGIPEILSFNENLKNSELIPQIAYFNYPEVPNPIKSIRFKAVFKKGSNKNETPILSSYNIGVKWS